MALTVDEKQVFDSLHAFLEHDKVRRIFAIIRDAIRGKGKWMLQDYVFNFAKLGELIGHEPAQAHAPDHYCGKYPDAQQELESMGFYSEDAVMLIKVAVDLWIDPTQLGEFLLYQRYKQAMRHRSPEEIQALHYASLLPHDAPQSIHISFDPISAIAAQAYTEHDPLIILSSTPDKHPIMCSHRTCGELRKTAEYPQGVYYVCKYVGICTLPQACVPNTKKCDVVSTSVIDTE